ncbi:MAG TPA: SHOCT domain-containing protein [Dehalococcoidales bacterium]|nr:SHOCT domain-containing protein [Dehalococcoidales bacterium]
MMWWNFHGWGFGLMGLLMMIFWGGIIWLIVWGISRLTRHEARRHYSDRDPLDIVRERYARGEITKEQFDQLKKDLKE